MQNQPQTVCIEFTIMVNANTNDKQELFKMAKVCPAMGAKHNPWLLFQVVRLVTS